MAKCDICGKALSFGQSVSHANVHSRRPFRPNIQKVTVFKDGKSQRMKLCTRCIRTMHHAR